MFVATSGFTSDSATLRVEEREETSYAKLSDVAAYELRYLPDTHEVVLLKVGASDGEDEAVYSEFLDPKEEA